MKPIRNLFKGFPSSIKENNLKINSIKDITTQGYWY